MRALCAKEILSRERGASHHIVFVREELRLTQFVYRCLYNALNDRIRNLLLSYDYSKSTNPLQPLASHLTSLLTRTHPETADITVSTHRRVLRLHKFILSARSPYFARKLRDAPETISWKIPPTIPPESFETIIRQLYLGELPRDLGIASGTGFTDSDILAGIGRLCKHLEIPDLSLLIVESGDRRLARQRRTDAMEVGQAQMQEWFEKNVVHFAIDTETHKASHVKWDRDNTIFADVLLRADEEGEDEINVRSHGSEDTDDTESFTNILGIPLKSHQPSSTTQTPVHTPRSPRSKLYPCHRAMLIRSEYFLTMFSSSFLEAQPTPHLQIISAGCTPAILEIVLRFLYTEKADFGLNEAIDVLFAADALFLDKLKQKAATVISTLGNGAATALPTNTKDPAAAADENAIDIYEILRAAWLTRVQRLEEFAARYIAYRLEEYIEEPEFAELVRESAQRINARQETDTIELLDDIRWYLSERFRLRFEDTGLENVMDEEQTTKERELDHIEDRDSRNGAQNGAGVLENPQNHTLASEDTDAQDTGASAPLVRTLSGDIAGDEFASDAFHYQLLLGRIETLLETLKLDA